jgi:tetratricopeptide (TPR) repeat protein
MGNLTNKILARTGPAANFLIAPYNAGLRHSLPALHIPHIMKIHFRPSMAALGLLAFLTNCATTVTEKEKPSNTSQLMNMPAASDARRPDSTGAATSAPDARTTDEANGIAATPATAVASAAALAADRPDPNALSASAASAEREKEKKMTALDYRNMLANADAIIKVEPKNSAAYLQRAKAKSYLKDYAQALPDYATAIKYQRNNPDAYYNRGVNHLMMKQYKSATSDFSGAIKYRADDKESYFGRGVAKMQMYQYKSAVIDFTKAIQLDSTYADAWEYRGISYSSFDKLSEARRDLEKAATLNPEAAKSLKRYVGNEEGKAPIKPAPVARPGTGYHPRPGQH